MKFNKKLNHTTSHILAMAVLKIFPNTILGFGPATNEGFYYDFKFEKNLLESDLLKIEKQMKKIISNNFVMKKIDSQYEYDFSHQPLKRELNDEFISSDKEVTFYSIVNPSLQKDLFVDLCAGGHLHKINDVKHFKLLSLAGAYWKGDSNNEQLTRIYGTAWDTKEELNNFLSIISERKERDHRKIGKELNLFMFDKLSGHGFPIWLEDGMKVKRRIEEQILWLDDKYGFKEVLTPIVGERELYVKSGHWDHYKDDMFAPIIADHEKLILRPMTCPHHILIFRSTRRSYRELPIRYSEQSNLYRHEKSGALIGMERVRGMQLTEGHIFAHKNQIISEFKKCYELITEALNMFNINIFYVSLSVRDINKKDKFYDDDKMWEEAEEDLRKVLKELGVEYKEMKGEAAFYGPKIDIQIKTSLGHEVTMSTLQLDFLLPKKFDLTFINSDGELETPVIIHRGLISTYERFLAILLEQTKGNLPFWLSPKQVAIIPVNEEHNDYSNDIYKMLKQERIHVLVDDRNERVSKKIREAQIAKTKIQIVIGDKEVENDKLSLRFYGSEKIKIISKDKIVNYLRKLTIEKK
ncbi:MAG: threonine--tRNA ligase [Mycoplasmataceae bacterium]|nr:threonine--tRNA ligase [Mycoplasmataceae bacterium]